MLARDGRPNLESIPGWATMSESDRAELRKFDAYLSRRVEKPDEPEFHAYAEMYGEAVFEDRDTQRKEGK